MHTCQSESGIKDDKGEQMKTGRNATCQSQADHSCLYEVGEMSAAKSSESVPWDPRPAETALNFELERDPQTSQSFCPCEVTAAYDTFQKTKEGALSVQWPFLNLLFSFLIYI